MQELTFDLVHIRIREEIERVVHEALAAGRIVHAGRNATRLLRTYPDCGVGLDILMNEIGATAAGAGVPVELSRAEEPIFAKTRAAV